MLKRGQITTFIIVGILVLVVTGLILFLSKSLIEDKTAVEEEKTQQANVLSDPIQHYIQSCLEKTGEDALIHIGQHGGYYELPDLSSSLLSVPYYFYDNQSYFLSKEELEFQYSQYINYQLFFCLRNFEAFEKQGYQIKQDEVNTTTRITTNQVLIEINFPVNIEK